MHKVGADKNGRDHSPVHSLQQIIKIGKKKQNDGFHLNKNY